MKIGIITYHSAHNYGAVLQAFALQEYLQKQGHDVQIINYKIKEIENFYRLIKFKKSKHKSINVAKKTIKKVKLHLFERQKLTRKKKFDDFINNKMNLTIPCKTLAELRVANFDFDLMIAGSDQIWNRKHTKGLKPAYFLDFGPKEAKRISYAASIGEDFISEDDELVFQRYLKNLDMISVREHKAIELIQHLTPKKIEEVVDPSQLLEKEDYEKIIEHPKIKGDYILVHKMGNPEEIIKVAKKVSEELNLPIVHNMDKGTFKNEIALSKYFSPGEFLGCIEDAKFVITSSFHATSFSLIYGKPFITMPFVGRASRMINLLKNLDLFDHYVETVDDLKSLDSYNENYDEVHERMRKQRKSSEDFLKRAIELKKQKIDDDYFKTGDKFSCYGCTACANICPQKAITMVEDDEGFIYPEIDKGKCVNCGLCEKNCIYHNEKLHKKYDDKKSYAIYNKDEKIRESSSSGGAFTGLYKNIINKGGYVVGVKYDKNMVPVYDIASTEKECEAFKGSKYVRADVGDIYIRIKDKLIKNKIVLATGTPCFIAGLNSYLGKKYDNLYTMDILCHGTPSPKVFKEYISDLEKKYESKVVDFKFRDKKNGWQTATITINFENGKTISNLLVKENFGNAFSKGLISRPACYNCEYVGYNVTADLRVADFWATRSKYKDIDDNKGISIVLINSEKGKNLFDEIKDSYNVLEIPYEDALIKNHMAPDPVTDTRQRVFNEIKESSVLSVLAKYNKRNKKKKSKIKKLIPKPVKRAVKKIIKK